MIIRQYECEQRCPYRFLVLLLLTVVSFSVFPTQLAGQTLSKKTHNLAPLEDNSSQIDFKTTSKSVPKPLIFFQNYLQKHQSNLSPDSNFAVIPYWCPERAGNILHNLINNAAWSILHNRTILLQYNDGNPQPKANAREFCESILVPKFPCFESIQKELQLPDPVVVDLTKENANSSDWPQVVYFPQIPDLGIPSPPGAPITGWASHPVNRQYKSYLLKNNFVPSIIQLYALGPSFTHGMILRHFFDWPEPTVTTTAQVSIALHSRHIVDADDGHWIMDEIKCLEELFSKHNTTTDCVVYLLSDRETTLDLLQQWLQEHSCRGVVARHAMTLRKSTQVEHGPFSGLGFIEDLVVGSQARTALVGSSVRSSYMLLEALATYDTYIIGDTQPLDYCELPKKPKQGYNYGPGTPNFYRPKFLPPMPPNSVVSAYLEQHWTQYAVIDFECNHIFNHVLANALLLSITTNRTMLLRNSERNCPAYPELAEYESDRMAEPMQLDLNESLDSRLDVVMFPLTTHLNLSVLEESAVNQELLVFGPDYLYGLLWSTLFKLPPVKDPGQDKSTLVIDLDREATVDQDHHCFSNLETNCLVISIGSFKSQNFTLNCTIAESSDWLHRVSLATQSTHLISGRGRSWLWEVLVYRKLYYNWQAGRWPPTCSQPIEHCIIG